MSAAESKRALRTKASPNPTQRALRAERRKMVGSGDRSEKIRTYNFPQNRVTDHRMGLTVHKLPTILEGDLDPLIDPLSAHFQAKNLQ